MLYALERKGGEHMAVKSDATCQTDTHVIEQHIDKKYEWNEWELRRKALRLVLDIFCGHHQSTLFSLI